MKNIPRVIGIVGCALAALVAVGGVLYFTGWLTWRWETSRAQLPSDACAFVGRSGLRTVVPQATFESESNSSETGDSLTCHAQTPPSAPDRSASARVTVDRNKPASGFTRSAEARARWSANHTCEALRKRGANGQPLPRLTEPADQTCGFTKQDGTETTVELVVAQSVDTVSIVYRQRDTNPEAAGAAVASLADEILANLAATGNR